MGGVHVGCSLTVCPALLLQVEAALPRLYATSISIMLVGPALSLPSCLGAPLPTVMVLSVWVSQGSQYDAVCLHMQASKHTVCCTCCTKGCPAELQVGCGCLLALGYELQPCVFFLCTLYVAPCVYTCTMNCQSSIIDLVLRNRGKRRSLDR